MSELHRITVRPEQCAGRPCIRGLRVRVKDNPGTAGFGSQPGGDPGRLPYLEPEDITAALEFAAVQTDYPILRSGFA